MVWLDAFITNIDRTIKNTNLLWWNKELWLIDHGASFYFHHSWSDWEKAALSPFAFAKDHVFLPQATQMEKVDAEMKALLPNEKLKAITDLIPTDWLNWEGSDQSPEEIRNVYYNFLVLRKENSINFIKEIENARKTLL